ncbi:MAG TPA: hypothetical protein VFO41_16225, partial [Alphaproteobacteria bacterium]|nr:hypothetical protein [Alphaproteobacteria bacterium]
DWETADGALVDFVAALNRFRSAHVAITNDQFPTGQTRRGIRDVTWLHPAGREMTGGDWTDMGASVLGMRLQAKGEDLMVWFNRTMDAVPAKLPGGKWRIAMLSDDHAEAPIGKGTVTLPMRSVVVIEHDFEASGAPPDVPPGEPQEAPAGEPQEVPVTNPDSNPQPQPDQLPGNAPEEVPGTEPAETPNPPPDTPVKD